MAAVLSHFTKERGKVPGELDIPALIKLSDDEFLEAHQNESAVYLKNHGEIPRCSECKTSITSNLDYVRYYGINLHNKCFDLVYSRERHSIEKEKRVYWDKLSNLKV